MKEDAKNKARTDSEGLKIVTVHDETEEDGKSLNSAAKEAFEAEQKADEDDATKQEVANQEAFQAFLDSR